MEDQNITKSNEDPNLICALLGATNEACMFSLEHITQGTH